MIFRAPAFDERHPKKQGKIVIAILFQRVGQIPFKSVPLITV